MTSYRTRYRASGLSMLLVVGLFLSTLAFAGCKHPSPEQCLEICFKHSDLHVWEDFEVKSSNMNEADKTALKAKTEKLIKDIHEREFDPGLRNCILSCKRGADLDIVGCMDKATTADDARTCNKKYGW